MTDSAALAAELREYESRIADETLAVEVTYGDAEVPQVEKA